MQGAQEAMADSLRALASVPSARPLQPEPFYPPNKFPWEVRGYPEPPGARQTGQDSPQEQEALLGELAEASSGHDKTSGALPRFPQLPLPHPRQGGRRLGMASSAMTRGATCPQRVSMDKTRQGI